MLPCAPFHYTHKSWRYPIQPAQCHCCRSRFWLFISYVVSFGAVVGAVWVLLQHYGGWMAVHRHSAAHLGVLFIASPSLHLAQHTQIHTLAPPPSSIPLPSVFGLGAQQPTLPRAVRCGQVWQASSRCASSLPVGCCSLCPAHLGMARVAATRCSEQQAANYTVPGAARCMRASPRMHARGIYTAARAACVTA